MLLIDDRLASAKSHLAAGRGDNAALIFESVLEINPNHPEALRGIASIRLAQRNFADALKLAGLAAGKDPTHLAGLALLAQAALLSEQSDLANAAIEQGFALDPLDPDICALKAGMLAQAGQTVEAERIFIDAIARNPHDISLLKAISAFYAANGTVAPALDYIQRALAEDPDNPELIANLGYQLVQLGDHERALPLLERAYLGAPANVATLLCLAQSLIALGRMAEAMRTAQRAVGLFPDFLPAWQIWLTVKTYLGDGEAALAEFTKRAQQHKDRTGCLLTMAAAKRVAGQPEAALRLLQPLAGRLEKLPDAQRGEASSLMRDCLLSLGHLDQLPDFVPPLDFRAAVGLAELDEAISLSEDTELHEALAATGLLVDNSLSILEAVVLLRFRISASGHDPRPQSVFANSTLAEIVALIPDRDFTALDAPRAASEAHRINAIPLSSIVSLPKAVRGGVNSAIPYLKAKDAQQAKWRRSLDDLPRPIVALSWDATRPGLLLEDFRPVLTGFSGTVVSIVWDESRHQLAQWPEIIDAGAHFTDLGDLAAVLAEVDAAIGPDGLAMHFAGALGLRGAVLSLPNPSWYWHANSSGDSWYPSVKVMTTRQFGHWSELMSQLQPVLAAFLQDTGGVKNADGADD